MPDTINPRLLNSEPLCRCQLDECRAACCLYGVWVGKDEVDQIITSAVTIMPYLPTERRDPEIWFTGSLETDPNVPGGAVIHSRVLDDANHYGNSACIFMRPDWRCALQVAAQEDGLHPWHWKPMYCILHPLDLDDKGRITLDEAALLAGEPASCLRPIQDRQPLLLTFEPELRYFLGDAAYEALLPSSTEET
jgi:hypothetical protein